MAQVDWMWLFVDTPSSAADTSLAFWQAVTATTPTPWRGDRDEFTTLRPDGEDAWFRFQRIDGPGGVHLNLDVADPATTIEEARARGATVLATRGTYNVMASPGGFVFCLTTTDRPRHVGTRRGVTSRADQVCLDIPATRYDEEVVFWAGLTGWHLGSSVVRPEFHWIETPPSQPVRMLLQRLDEATEDRVTAHLDLAV